MFKNIKEFQQSIQNNPNSLIDAIDYYNTEIKNSKLNAYITYTPELAMIQAKKVIEKIKSGKPSALCGMPLAVKDNFCTEGVLTTMASKMLENYIPGYESTVTSRLFENDAIMVGKANMDEFAMGASGKHSFFGKTISPIKMNNSNESLIPGGSSSGSAAAVAGNLALAALGSDTGGSVRQPASLCGIVGFKPSYGRCSRFGIVAYASSLDQAGFMTHTVNDAALIFSLTQGVDGKDATLIDLPKEDFTNIKPDIKGKIIGIPKEFMMDGIHPEIIKAWDSAKKLFKQGGAIIKEVSLQHAMESIKVYYFISTAEASSNFARYDGIKYGHRTTKQCNTIEELVTCSRTEGFGHEVKNRILIGTRNLLSDSYKENYERILRLRMAIKQEFAEVFQSCDAILCPTTPNLAPPINYQQTDLEEYINDILTVPANIAGLPAISIPFGKASCGRPIGLQLMAKEFTEVNLLNCATFLEQCVI